MVRVRQATVADAAAVLAVYAPYIEDTAITFETSVPTVEAFAARMEGIVGTYPYLVVECDGAIVGFAYAQHLGERGAYAWNVELSVYFAAPYRGLGWGSVLFWALVDLLSQQGVRNAYSLITVPNEASRRLHAKLGFELMGIQRNAGYKCGAWHDVAWLRKAIGPFDDAPTPIVPMRDVDESAVREVLETAEEAMGHGDER